MKKLFLAMIAVAALSPLPVMAEGNGSGTQFDVHGDVFPLFFDIFSVGGEAALPAKNFTLVADVEYSPNFFWATNVTVFDVSARVRYYFGDAVSFAMPDFLSFLKRSALAGWFVGVGGAYDSLYESWGGYTWTGSSFGLIVETGSKYFFDRHWYLEGLIGLDLQTSASWKVSGGGTSESFSGNSFAPSALYSDLSLGWAF